MRKHNLTKREIARFCGQIRMLLSSGIPLIESMRIVSNISRRGEYNILIGRVSEGESLATAMEDYFPPMVVSSISGAQRAGNLEEVLERLSGYYEERAGIEEKIKSALVYPSFVISLSFLSLIVLFLFVLPGFKNLFLDMGSDLPLFTQIIMGLGDVFVKVWYLPVLGLIIGRVSIACCRKTRQGELKIDGLLLKIRPIRVELIIQSFRTLGSLLRGGIPVVEALETAVNSVKNRAFQDVMFEIKRRIENGERLSEVLSEHKLFPKEAVQMISVGEGSGKLSEMLLSAAEFYEKEREVFIKRFTALLEPALTLFVGIIVGIIAMAVFLPMAGMISGLK